MRKLFIVLAFIFAILGVIFTILPTEKLGLIPVGFSIMFGFFALKKSELGLKSVPKFIVIFSIILMIVAVVKIALIKDEVVIDQKDEIQKVESQKQDQKDLEDLEGL